MPGCLHTGGINGTMKTMPDPDPLQEVREAREEIAKRFNHDLDAILAEAKKIEQQEPGRIAELQPVKPNMSH
jgi:hypothetical protein